MPGTARITVTASRRGYRDATTSFYVDVNGKTISAPTVYMNYPNGASYTNGSWSNQNITFTLTGYSSGRTAYSYERPAGGSSSQWGNRRELPDGILTMRDEDGFSSPARQRRRQRGHQCIRVRIR